MAKVVRNAGDLSIHDGIHRSFEWYWALDGTMPGLDAFENLPEGSQDDVLASLQHWGAVPPGGRAAQSRVNQESDDPLIVAVKAGKHRFTDFREESGPTWILCHYYVKQSGKRDKAGDRAIDKTVESRESYFQAVKDGTYYERS